MKAIVLGEEKSFSPDLETLSPQAKLTCPSQPCLLISTIPWHTLFSSSKVKLQLGIQSPFSEFNPNMDRKLEQVVQRCIIICFRYCIKVYSI